MQIDRFILEVVILEAERMAGVHMNQLTDIPFRLRPMQLVAPWFFDSRDDVAQRSLLEEKRSPERMGAGTLSDAGPIRNRQRGQRRRQLAFDFVDGSEPANA